ncbi:MAG: hypothetical protein IJO40_10865, partial [Thermoguttaceae bacterium]|nr:hypothetical protein [Thermoguttaceae bacterium]
PERENRPRTRDFPAFPAKKVEKRSLDGAGASRSSPSAADSVVDGALFRRRRAVVVSFPSPPSQPRTLRSPPRPFSSRSNGPYSNNDNSV